MQTSLFDSVLAYNMVFVEPTLVCKISNSKVKYWQSCSNPITETLLPVGRSPFSIVVTTGSEMIGNRSPLLKRPTTRTCWPGATEAMSGRWIKIASSSFWTKMNSRMSSTYVTVASKSTDAPKFSFGISARIESRLV